MNARIDKPFWIGVDVSKAKLDVSVAPVGMAPADWKRLPVGSFAHTKEGIVSMLAWLGEHADLSACKGVCVESTGAYSRRFAGLVRGRGLPAVSIINPARSVQFARSCGARHKTDRVDAALLAVFGAIHTPPPTAELPENQMRVRELDRARLRLVEVRTGMKNRIEQALDRPETSVHYSAVIQSLDAEIEAIEAKLKTIVLEDERLARQIELLDSIPGIGPVIATTLTVELGDLSRFSREQIVGVAGLFARQHESGSSVRRKGRLARGGGGRLRRVTYMGCTSLLKAGSAFLAHFGRALIERGKPGMCALGAMMRKLLRIARAVVISGKPYNPDLAGRSKPSQMPARLVLQTHQEASAMP